MFDSVAAQRPEGRRRRGAAALLAGLACATLLGALTTFRAPPAQAALPTEVMLWPGEPQLPPKPAPSGGGATPRKAARPKPAPVAPAAPAPPPPTPVEAALDLTPPPPEAAPPALPEGGGGSGGPSGPGIGPGPGGPGTCPTCSGGGGGGGGDSEIHAVPAERVEPLTRVVPRWPRTASDLGLTEGTCVARVLIDETGTPADVTFVECPIVFQATTRAAAMRWRFNPLLEHGRAVRARFDLTFRYVR